MRFTSRSVGDARTRWRVLLRFGAGLAVATILLSASCGDDDDGDESSTGRTTTTSMADRSTTTQPQASGDTRDAAFTIVESVVLDATDLTDRLLQDPALAEEDGDEIERLRELYTEDSPTPPEVRARLDELASNDQMVRPGPSGVFREFVVHGMAAVDAVTVRFEFCAGQDQETVDASGTVVARFAEVTRGTGEARYVDGRWLFYGLHRDEESSVAPDPGDELAGLCQALYGGDGQG